MASKAQSSRLKDAIAAIDALPEAKVGFNVDKLSDENREIWNYAVEQAAKQTKAKETVEAVLRKLGFAFSKSLFRQAVRERQAELRGK